MNRRTIGRPWIWVTGLSVLVGLGELWAEPEWGKANRDGLATRLVPLVGEPRVGKALTFRLEAKNTSEVTVYADIQSLAYPDRLLEVKNEAGERAARIPGRFRRWVVLGCRGCE